MLDTVFPDNNDILVSESDVNWILVGFVINAPWISLNSLIFENFGSPDFI